MKSILSRSLPWLMFCLFPKSHLPTLDLKGFLSPCVWFQNAVHFCVLIWHKSTGLNSVILTIFAVLLGIFFIDNFVLWKQKAVSLTDLKIRFMLGSENGSGSILSFNSSTNLYQIDASFLLKCLIKFTSEIIWGLSFLYEKFISDRHDVIDTEPLSLLFSLEMILGTVCHSRNCSLHIEFWDNFFRDPVFKI